jgi:hypothetical protein
MESKTGKSSLGRSSLGLAMAALLMAVSVIMAPTPASAFNIRGLIRGALAHYGGYRAHGGQHVYSQVASRHSRHSDDDNDEDAAPGSTNTPPANQDSGTSYRRQPTAADRVTSSSFTVSARSMTTASSYAEEPRFAPSR